MTFQEWQLKQGILPATYGTMDETAKQGMLDQFNVENSAGKDPWSMAGTGGLALGGIQTGAALLGTFDQMKTAKLQRNLLGQQYDTNNEKMQSWRDNKTAVNKAFGSGLAASGVQ